MTKKHGHFLGDIGENKGEIETHLEKCIKTEWVFVIKCQNTLAKCAKSIYNNRAVLYKAFLCNILRRHAKCPTVYFKA